MWWMITIPYAILLAIYCMFEKRENFRLATTFKVILSAYAAGFCAYAAILLGDLVYMLFALGLLFAVPADFFLQYIKSDLKKYRFGIFFFGAMHVCLLISFYLRWSISWIEFVIWGVLIGVLLIFQNSEKWKMGKEKGQLTVYTVLVTFMAAKAMSLVFVAPSPQTVAAALGGLFFFLSDLFLGIWDYYESKFVFLCLNRVIYFAGQLALAFYLLVLLP